MINIKSFEFNLFQENSYILYDETLEAVIIDPGCSNKQENEELSSFIADNKLKPVQLLCTHLHLDHIYGVPYVHKIYGLDPKAHRFDVEKVPSMAEQAQLFGIRTVFDIVPVKEYLVGNQVVKFGKSELQTLSVPGHSPGSMAFYNSKNGFVMVGDTLFAGSIGRTDLWGGNQDVLVAAIQDKILSLPDETVVYPGHGTHTSVIEEKLNNPYL